MVRTYVSAKPRSVAEPCDEAYDYLRTNLGELMGNNYDRFKRRSQRQRGSEPEARADEFSGSGWSGKTAWSDGHEEARRKVRSSAWSGNSAWSGSSSGSSSSAWSGNSAWSGKSAWSSGQDFRAVAGQPSASPTPIPAAQDPLSESAPTYVNPGREGSEKKRSSIGSIIGMTLVGIIIAVLLAFAGITLFADSDPVVEDVDTAEPVADVPIPVATTEFANGTFTVGKDVDPGIYYVSKIDESEWDTTFEWTMNDTDYIHHSYLDVPEMIEAREGDVITLKNAQAVPESQRPEVPTDKLQGIYIVGEDIDPGRYVVVAEGPDLIDFTVTTGLRHTYEEEKQDGGFGLFYAHVFVEEGDYLTINSGVGYAFADRPEPDLPLDGLYEVGLDIAPGVYRVVPHSRGENIDLATYAAGNMRDRYLFRSGTSFTYVDLREGEFVEISGGELVSPDEDVNVDLSMFSGTLEVGRDLPAGEYRLTAESEDDMIVGEVIRDLELPLHEGDNGYIVGDGSVYVTVEDGEYLGVLGAEVTPIADAEPDGRDTNVSLKVGLDIAPGTYDIEPAGDFPTIEIAKNSRWHHDNDTEYENLDGPITVDLDEGEILILSDARIIR